MTDRVVPPPLPPQGRLTSPTAAGAAAWGLIPPATHPPPHPPNAINAAGRALPSSPPAYPRLAHGGPDGGAAGGPARPHSRSPPSRRAPGGPAPTRPFAAPGGAHPRPAPVRPFGGSARRPPPPRPPGAAAALPRVGGVGGGGARRHGMGRGGRSRVALRAGVSVSARSPRSGLSQNWAAACGATDGKRAAGTAGPAGINRSGFKPAPNLIQPHAAGAGGVPSITPKAGARRSPGRLPPPTPRGR